MSFLPPGFDNFDDDPPAPAPDNSPEAVDRRKALKALEWRIRDIRHAAAKPAWEEARNAIPSEAVIRGASAEALWGMEEALKRLVNEAQRKATRASLQRQNEWPPTHRPRVQEGRLSREEEEAEIEAGHETSWSKPARSMAEVAASRATPGTTFRLGKRDVTVNPHPSNAGPPAQAAAGIRRPDGGEISGWARLVVVKPKPQGHSDLAQLFFADTNGGVRLSLAGLDGLGRSTVFLGSVWVSPETAVNLGFRSPKLSDEYEPPPKSFALSEAAFSYLETDVLDFFQDKRGTNALRNSGELRDYSALRRWLQKDRLKVPASTSAGEALRVASVLSQLADGASEASDKKFARSASAGLQKARDWVLNVARSGLA